MFNAPFCLRLCHKGADDVKASGSEGECALQNQNKIEKSNKNAPSFTIIDVFSGVGGLSLGASRAGLKIALAVEKDPHIAAAHKLNFPGVKHLEEDVLEHSGRSLLANANLKTGELTGLVGGPPCQGFSSIGKKVEGDPRNQLFTHFFKLISEARPQFFLVENVPGILNARYDSIRKKALSLVSDYQVLEPFLLKASDCGAPTSRVRVFFIGYRSDVFPDLTQEDFIPSKKIIGPTVQTALEGLPKRILGTWQAEADGWRVVRCESSGYYWDRITSNIPDGVGDQESIRRLKSESRVSGCLGTAHSLKNSTRYGKLEPREVDSLTKSRRLDPNEYCPTLRAGTGSDKGSFQAVRPIHPSEPRVITPREAARLQGFPDWYRFAPSKWHSFRMIGNSVSPFVSEFLFSRIRERLLRGQNKEI